MNIKIESIKDMMYAQMMYDLRQAKEKRKLFCIKYNIKYEQFEKRVLDNKQESFEEWDDYMEWKACQEIIKKVKNKKEEIRLIETEQIT